MEVKLVDEVENDDGTVSLEWETDEEAAVKLCQIGTKFLVYCKLLGLSADEVFEELEARITGDEQ